MYTDKWYFYDYDLRGSVTSILDPDGVYTSGYQYDAFGNTARKGDSDFNNEMEFTGSISDTSSGLYYMNSRYYNPKTGRFLTQDEAGGDAWTNNLYAYCGNNPVSFIDPTGYFWYYGNTQQANSTSFEEAKRAEEERKEQAKSGGSSGGGGSRGDRGIEGPEVKYNNLKEDILYETTGSGIRQLIDFQPLTCSGYMKIYYYMVPEDYHGKRLLTPMICQIDVHATTSYQDGSYVGGNGFSVSTFAITGISIDNKPQKISKDSNTSYLNDKGMMCDYYPGCTVVEQRYATAYIDYKIPYGATSNISFSWYADLDTSENGIGFYACTGGGTFNIRFSP